MQYDELTISDDTGYLQIECFESGRFAVHINEGGYEYQFKTHQLDAIELRDFLIRNYPLEDKKEED